MRYTNRMIESLRISGFRAAKNVELADLGQVNLFIGPNGTGKSSILSAAFLFCVDGDAGKLLAMVPPETSEVDADGAEKALGWLFTRNDQQSSTNREFSVAGQVDGVSRSVSVKTVDLSPGLIKEAGGQISRVPDSSVPPEISQDLNAIKDSAKLVLELSTHHGREINTGRLFISPSHGVFGESDRRSSRLPASLTRDQTIKSAIPSLAKMLDEAQQAGFKVNVQQLLKHIDSEIRDLHIGVATNGTPVVRVDHARLGLCPLSVLGDGVRCALHFALVVGPGRYKFVMFDEFDSSFHVTFLKRLAKFAKEIAGTGTQLFLTTHRADTVGAFVDLIEEGWQGLRVYQTRIENGEVVVQGYAGSTLLTAWRELALDIRVPA